MAQGIEGKVIVITGASSGLGEAAARRLAHDGARVVLGARRVDRLYALAEELGLGRDAAVQTDVTQATQVKHLVDYAVALHGRIDVLINNAGKSPLYDRPVDIDERLYDSVLDVNLKGPFRLTAAIGQRMLDDGKGGAIINISSVGAIRPRKNIITYAAAKSGLNAMTEAFADAYGPKVRVNCIMPGPFLTDISKAWDMDTFARRAERMALKRGGEPEEIVGAALYFASRASSFTTGSILPVDGGWLGSDD